MLTAKCGSNSAVRLAAALLPSDSNVKLEDAAESHLIGEGVDVKGDVE